MIKLEIEESDLGHLLTCLEVFASENRAKFLAVAEVDGVNPAALLGWWKAEAVREYSLCALTVPELMLAIEQGEKCVIE
ncbi:hypothetical protein [Frigoriglobus tundricola]|uniref:Uncharacterized protein n=1 Tax=Frigoriglobus tundricola TaxID=2774151 RepID=A0A6M5YJ08_9BACT|nr:hypothetical protein [Frigoriglobus tundricola]QJW93243.1 hypothetical protein FTUN_0748 [Frigoriglobus tundricola]